MTDYSELKRLAESVPEGFAAPEAYEEDRRYSDEEVALLEFMGRATPAVVLAMIAENERYRQYGCDTCDGSGHLHRIDGEYYGACTSCGAHELGRAKRERDQLRAEVEAMRGLLAECRLMTLVVNSGHSGVLRGMIDAAMSKADHP